MRVMRGCEVADDNAGAGGHGAGMRCWVLSKHLATDRGSRNSFHAACRIPPR
jgi:hypothetical protein